ncbi:V-type ATP synthase subunit D [Aestuariivita sp.]|jgi:V/A-type H+-transporting ATPase subunit D|uniref:V-type ATP synthase subunit D n=1 Tax=Aestuariivita sp. TaxID=1872407 RepID=UPI00217266CB|nr:V-type ATP synthase subunit D [Aestuariivita sp.]MCE8007781.1 V-type ATP synthase subunit D [Aestuariivita sp.]
MARLQLSKSSLAREMAQLRAYERFLPSLDLKRQQLQAEKAKAIAIVTRMEAEVEALAAQVGRDVPMLANPGIELKGLVHLTDYRVGTENVVGTRLPVLENVEVAVAPYSPMTKPHWVDDVSRLLHDMVEVRLRAKVARQRVAALSKAVDTITQRVNLFDKVLIPNARANIKRIRVYLSDQDMASVVRSKIAKRKRAAA